MEVQGTIENKNGKLSVATGKGVRLFAARALMLGIKMYIESGGRMQVSRMYTPANMRASASTYTGKQYPRSQKGLIAAFNDLGAWMQSEQAFEGVKVTNE